MPIVSASTAASTAITQPRVGFFFSGSVMTSCVPVRAASGTASVVPVCCAAVAPTTWVTAVGASTTGVGMPACTDCPASRRAMSSRICLAVW